MPSLTARVFNGGGDDHTGDAHVISDGPLNIFNPIQTLGWVGRDAKNQDEVNVFMAFDVSAMPLGSRPDGVNLQFTTSIATEGTGGVRVGMLVEDGTWEVNGFKASLPLPRYPNAFKFPNDGTAIPHATQDSSLTIEPDILISDFWTHSADIAFSAALFPADTVQVWGDGIGGEDETLNLIITIFNGARNVRNQTVVAFTIDSQAVSNTNNRLNLYLTETANDDNRPRLTVEWTLNPPDFTSSPVTTGDVSCSYTYTAVADPYVLGDFTTGLFVDVTYSLEVSPTGMTIVPSTGVISWTPTLAQEGIVHDVTVRATNEGGETEDQVYTVDIPVTATPSITSTPPADLEIESLTLFSYDADATNAVAGCQDSTLIWTIESIPPAGMIINSSSGLVEWTPTEAQEGTVVAVTIRATNFAPKFDEQTFTLNVPIRGCPDGVARTRRAVTGQARHRIAVSGEAQTEPAVTGQALARPAVTGRAIVRRAVSGFARRCSKE